MSPSTTHWRGAALVGLMAAAAVHAQVTDLPDLATVTQATELPANTASSTGDSSSATDDEPDETSTAADDEPSETSAASTTAATSADDESTTASPTTGSFTATFPDAISTTTSAGGIGITLTDLPTIAGAGIPTMVVPYTANAPFMQKSSMPEGTVFIAVGAVLAFLGACVLLWRGLVAWSINRSVKRRSALDVTGSEKTPRWGGGGGAGATKNAYSREYDMGSSMSLDALTSAGKPIRSPTFPHDEGRRQSSVPAAGLFFSPTAHVSNRVSSTNMNDRGSTYLPAGYYASPAAEIGGGRNSTAIGGSLAPYARHSVVNPSPPGTPGNSNSRSTSNFYSNPYPPSRDGLRNSSREGLRAPPSRDGYSSQRGSNTLYTQPSTSSLMVGTGGANARASSEYLGGQRAPSAVLDELFENHGNGPRERF